jgi:ribonuclease HI
MRDYHEEYINDAAVFRQVIVTRKMIHVVPDGGARPNPGNAGWGAIIRQNKAFAMMWRHFPHATNNTMELRAVTEALNCL